MIARAQQGLARSESEGQRRMRELHGGSLGNLEISPNLWAGVGLVRGERAPPWSGSARRGRRPDRGSTPRSASPEFILSGYPHLEEAYWFGEGVLPILRQRGRWQHPAPGRDDDALTTTPSAPAPGPAQPAAVS